MNLNYNKIIFLLGILSIFLIGKINAQSCDTRFSVWKSTLNVEVYLKADLVLPGITQFFVDYGDGNGPEEAWDRHLFHSYKTAGTYTICIIDTLCTSNNRRSCQTITLSENKVIHAGMQINKIGDGIYSIKDTSKSLLPIAARYWGDGNGQLVEGPDSIVKTYKFPGTYQVLLAIRDTDNNTDYVAEHLNVELQNYCKAGFQPIYSNQGVTLENHSFSTDSNTQYLWYVDNQVYLGKDLFLPYSGLESSEVVLLMDGLCKDSAYNKIYYPDTSRCGFSVNADIINQILNLTITPKDAALPETYHIDFGDGEQAQGLAEIPINHIYKDTGTYQICVSSFGLGGCGFTFKNCVTIQVNSMIPVCKPAFIAIPDQNAIEVFTMNKVFGTQITPQVTVNWGDGSLSTGIDSINYRHVYQNPGIYSITLTLMVPGGCIDSATQVSGAGANLTLSGKVKSQGKGTPYTQVYCIVYEPVKGTLTYFNEGYSDENGDYSFLVPPGYYLIQSNFAFDPETNGFFMPTYYPSEMNWDKATVITMQNSNRSGMDIELLPYSFVNQGNNELGGKVIYGKGNYNQYGEITYGTPVNKMLLYLLDDDGNVRSYGHSHSDGTFSFQNLPDGNYTVWAEMPGKITKTGQIQLSGNGTAKKDLKIIVGASEVSTGIRTQTASEPEWNLFPNPTISVLNISFAGKEKINRIEILDLNGRLILEEKKFGNNSFESLNLNQVSPGMYILRLELEKGAYVQKKFVKE